MRAIIPALTAVMLLAGAVAAAADGALSAPAAATDPIRTVALGTTAVAAASTDARAFQIASESSQAQFFIDEVLFGSPKTVVGSTRRVAGQITFDPADLASAQISAIQIDARTFATDSGQRDNMIRNPILRTGQHQYITFTPTRVDGLPERVDVGTTVPVQVTGELTIVGQTREVTFDGTVTLAAADRLEGTASTTIRHADWGITIPQVPSVAWVSETVRLQFDFVANAS